MTELDRRPCGVREYAENEKNVEGSSEECFRQVYAYNVPKKKPATPQIKQNIRRWKGIIRKRFPILKWLPAYKKKDLISDTIAGLTVGVMHIPQGMAYALLGGVPPVIGIYMAVFPVLMYLVMGTSHHVSMGTFAVVCMMVGKSVDEHANLNSNNSTEGSNDGTTNLSSVEVASALCLIVGIWQVGLGIFRLGALSVLLSETLISGFTTGAAVHVFTSQVRNLLGIEGQRFSGPLKIIYYYIDIFSNIGNINVIASSLSLSFTAFIVFYNELIKPLIQKKFGKKIPFPVELLVIITGTLLSKNLNIKENYNVSVVDFVAKGLPYPTVPRLEILPRLVVDGLIVAIVAVSINISMATIFAQKLGYEVDGNQEILASGIGNIFSSFFSCMPFAASLSRSLIQVSAGGKTQITSAVSSVFLIIVLLFIGPFFEPLPYCVLSTIIVVALKGMFMQIKDLPSIYRKSKLDGSVWIMTFLAVVVLDISYGLVIGLLASIGCLIFRAQKFQLIKLGYVPNGNVYLNVNRFKKARPFPDILILQFVGGFHFANANNVRRQLLNTFFSFNANIPPSIVNEKKVTRRKSVVIDFSCVPFVDLSAVKTLSSVYRELRRHECQLLLSGCILSVYDAFDSYGFFTDFPKPLVYHNLENAVEAATTMAAEPLDSSECIMRF